MGNVQVLDCTLRDGAYIVDSQFGEESIRGIIKRLSDAKIDIIECGWLKNEEHRKGSVFYHVPNDVLRYLTKKDDNVTYVAMIDYNRYDIDNLTENDGKSIDAIRVVFPKNAAGDGLRLIDPIRKKGYKVFIQIANTLAYTDFELLDLIKKINAEMPDAVSIVDTFGAMYEDDLLRIAALFQHNLHPSIKLGFHSHNNLQLSFALTMSFIKLFMSEKRDIVVDSCLFGMGRGAGNTNTELITGFLNKKLHKDYNINVIIDTIDVYMSQYIKKYEWGYSMPYYISGTYQSHVNNISYLIKQHKVNARTLKTVIENMDEEKRRVYDYSNLENVYLSCVGRDVSDVDAKNSLKASFFNKEILLIAPGHSIVTEKESIMKKIENSKDLIVIGINLMKGFDFDFVFFGNEVRYEYCKENDFAEFEKCKKIVTSNIQVGETEKKNFYVVNYNDLIDKEKKLFDNSIFLCLRLLDYCKPKKIYIAGFDGYGFDANYADGNMETQLSNSDIKLINYELKTMFDEFVENEKNKICVEMITHGMLNNMIE